MRRLLALFPLGLALVAAGCGGSSGVTQDVGAVVGMIQRAELTSGAANVEQWYRAHGTYVGANPGVAGVKLVRADGSGWCLETPSAHENGPNGTPAPGPC